MNETSDMLQKWGCPLKYCREYDDSLRERFPLPVREAADRVSRAANWSEGHDAALDAMIAARDIEAIQQWGGSAAWWTIGHKASSGNSHERCRRADQYEEEVTAAFRALAATVEHLDWSP